jgi:class 3 adenylate cyclase/tetratricopeptide (TPR) repeat protein
MSSLLRDAAPVAYTPGHLVEKVLTSRSAVEGERKQVTVLFTDVSGFTAMSERLDPEEVHDIMDRAFEVVLGAVHRYEGTINQFLGDGVMALFGAPIAHEDHPHRAIRAALAIQLGLQPLRDDVRRAHGMEFRVRIGLNTGLVVVGAIGSDLRTDYTAVGDTTNLAARLLNVAQPGQIVISESTRRLTEGFFTVEDLGEFTVKGKTAPVHAYAATSEVVGRTRLEVSRERGLTALVGREGELQRLRQAFEQAAAGRGAIVLVSGEPGVGKSRLLYEFLHRLEGTGAFELEGTCLSHGRSMPYHPILEVLRRYFGMAVGMTNDAVRERIRQTLADIPEQDDPDAASLIAHFLGVSVPAELLARLTGSPLKARTLQVLRRVLLGASRARPLVLVIENMHWVDGSSEEFLGELVPHLPASRVLLVLSTRPGYEAPWSGTVPMPTIPLEGLDAEEVQRMIRSLLGAERVAVSLLEAVVAKGAGNPLYVEEILRQLRETHGILVEDGEARLSRVDVAVPARIHDIIASRIDRLADPLKETLQVAAVVGRTFAVPLLARLLDGQETLAQHLDNLCTLGFVFRLGSEPHAGYGFKHALTQEVAYGSLLERRRRRYHAAAGAGLEEIHAEHLDEAVELLAHHFGLSAETEKAVDYTILAAAKAQRRWANTEAVTRFESALKRLDTMPDTEPNRSRRIDAVVKQAEVMFALGRHAEHVQGLEAIRDLTVNADAPRRAAWLYWAGFFHSLTGARGLEVPIAYCREAVALADLAGLDDIRAFAECCLTHVYVSAGKLRDAVATGERALAFFEPRENVWWACRTLWGLSMACNAIGEWERSLGYCRQGFEHGQAVNDLRLKVVGWWRTGSTHIQRGDAATGIRCCEEALALSPVPFDATMVRGMRAYGLVKAGQIEAGIAELEEVVAWLGKSNLHYTRTIFDLFMADSYLRQGERRRARPLIESGLEVSRRLGYLHLEGVAERLLGDCLTADDPPAAAAHLERATDILEGIDARNELAKALVGRAALSAAAGDLRDARCRLDRALEIFDALGTLDGPDEARRLLDLLTSQSQTAGA